VERAEDAGRAVVEQVREFVNMKDRPDGMGDRAKAPGNTTALPATGGRIDSVDALRGLTILLMVFVNDLGKAAPAWMLHIQPPNADGMTLADTVFPAFLFIVGVSIPLAFERAEAAGRSKLAPLGHIFTRTAALLFMGVIELNRGDDRTLPRGLWGVFAYTVLILAWCSLPRERGWKRNLALAVKALGGTGLVVLLAIYRRAPESAEIPFLGSVEGWVWLRTGWWGILGLIGWAYLTVGLLVLLLGSRREWLMGALALLMVLHLAFNHGGLFTHLQSKAWLGPAAPALAAIAGWIEGMEKYVSLRDALGSLAGITMAGCLLGTILRRDSDVANHRARLGWAGTFAVGLLAAGFVTDTFEGINKIAATPTWCLWCAALTCIVWMALYGLLDVARLTSWSLLLRAAGTNALVAYFLHPIVVGSLSLAGLGKTVLAYKEATDPWMVVGGSLAMTVMICAAAGLLGRLGLRVRL
jgi:heparan-alpha-glucosaminide N-acetyltransferase